MGLLTIDANAKSRAFNITEIGSTLSVSISGMTIQNGNDTVSVAAGGQGGGGIYSNVGTFALAHVLVRNCTSQSTGGGLVYAY